MSQTDKKQIFFQKCRFSSRKRSFGHIECNFNNPADFFGGKSNRFSSVFDADKKQKETEMIFFKKGTFQQNDLGYEDCSFDKSNEKISTKRPIVLAQCPKMQNF